MNTQKRTNLGRGLSALLGNEAVEAPPTLDRLTKLVPIAYLRPGQFQPRTQFDDEQMAELALSIKQNGILQPLIARPDPDDSSSYEIICGERRWRAAQIARLHEVPIIIRELTNQQAIEIGLVENIQREDLSSLDEAEGYQRLIEEFSYTQEDMARVVGKSRSHIANTLRLLSLVKPIKDMLRQDKLSAGHARALLNAADGEAIAKRIIAEGLSVRATEVLVRKQAEGPSKKPMRPAKASDTLALERDITDQLGLVATISGGAEGGSLTVHFKTLDQLDELVQRISGTSP
jgi:ParB family chromosome partitioning protein